ncbi:mCG147766 [Mus musculus]|nr:mCG147766 [Mus musculus]
MYKHVEVRGQFVGVSSFLPMRVPETELRPPGFLADVQPTGPSSLPSLSFETGIGSELIRLDWLVIRPQRPTVLTFQLLKLPAGAVTSGFFLFTWF